MKKKYYNTLIRQSNLDKLDEKEIEYKISIFNDSNNKKYLDRLKSSAYKKLEEYIDNPNINSMIDIHELLGLLTEFELEITVEELDRLGEENYSKNGGLDKGFWLKWIKE